MARSDKRPHRQREKEEERGAKSIKGCDNRNSSGRCRSKGNISVVELLVSSSSYY